MLCAWGQSSHGTLTEASAIVTFLEARNLSEAPKSNAKDKRTSRQPLVPGEDSGKGAPSQPCFRKHIVSSCGC